MNDSTLALLTKWALINALASLHADKQQERGRLYKYQWSKDEGNVGRGATGKVFALSKTEALNIVGKKFSDEGGVFTVEVIETGILCNFQREGKTNG